MPGNSKERTEHLHPLIQIDMKSDENSRTLKKLLVSGRLIVVVIIIVSIRLFKFDFPAKRELAFAVGMLAPPP
jgi:hypothetical protein